MKILVAPLNWGLGHATRCIPIIHHLLSEGHQVTLAADGYPLTLLQQHFPTLPTVTLTSYNIHYSSSNSQVISICLQLPKLLWGILKEHIWLRQFVRKQAIDQVISDNRFGLWHKGIKTVYITHQLRIKMPEKLTFLEPLAQTIHAAIIKNFDECWIPDSESNNGLSGDLAHSNPLPQNARFIGPLTRFKNANQYTPNSEYNVVAVLSGVEPQRSLFEKEIIQRFQHSSEKVLLIQGKPQQFEESYDVKNIRVTSHLSDEALATVLLGARKIICRSGYSSIMDLYQLGCLQKAELIPTPGQTEQEYLAKHIAKLIQNAGLCI